ncbi:serine/threonine-protein kinase [Sandaracinus amylolyticus]|uniref:serine/threonine-protein kinase n=1 Tax=Sandaracinus amylolyticus TaxID=927083 RepID=UPI001F0068AD|nr:serine/threonine-protein kinase [Sandaracinus amylolyticus]
MERFDEYVLVGKLGHGGMAEVFLALSQGPNGFRKLLVIKRLHAHMKDEPQIVEMFLDEAKLAARLHHPNVVQTNKVGSHRGHHFLAMEYLDGQPLNRVIKRTRDDHGVIPPPIAARVVSDALDGLHYAHEARDYDGTPLQIVHRDVSPHNLFVTYDGQVKLLDFGIAKAVTQESNTRTGLIKGKFAYIAPEQARGEVVDRRADLWSMGITLWECLAGRRLFRGASDVAILHATLNDEIPRLGDVVTGVPDELARIVDKSLQRNPDRRYATAAEFKQDLDDWLATQSRASSRTTLAALMRTVFSDTIEAQKESLRVCLAQVDAVSGELRIGAPGPLPREGTPVTTSAKVVKAPPVLDVTRAERAPDARWKLVAIAGAVVIGVLLAVVVPFAIGGETTAETTVSPEPAAAPAPVAGSAPVGPEPSAPIEPRPEVTSPAAARDELPQAPSIDSRRGGARSPVRRPATGVRAAAPAPPPVATTAELAPAPSPPSQVATGQLSLDTTPWAIVFLGGRRLGITPLENVELPAGTHTLTLRNPERGIETTYRVTVEAGQPTSRRIALE